MADEPIADRSPAGCSVSQTSHLSLGACRFVRAERESLRRVVS